MNPIVLRQAAASMRERASVATALAIADWLDVTADEGCECGLADDDPYCSHEAAEAVARTYLNEYL